MGYTTITFLIFTLLVIAAYYMFPVKKYQWTVLLAASYVFYLWASWRYVIFILITTYTVYFAALAMYRNIKEAKETVAQHKEEWDKEQKLLENKSQEIKNMEKTIGRE